jgi:hypothetical protein
MPTVESVNDEIWQNMFGSQFGLKIKQFIQNVLSLNDAKSFCCPSIGRIYMPNSVNVIPDDNVNSINLNSIIYKIQYARYSGFLELFDDLHIMIAASKVHSMVSYLLS